MAAISSPSVVLSALAPASAEAVAVLPVEPPVAADAGTAEVPLLEVVSDLPSLGHKERATAVAEVGGQEPASLIKGRPSTPSAMVPDASTAGGPDALEEGRAEPRPVLGSCDLIPARREPNERCGQALRFWTRGALKSLFVLDDEREEQSQDELREYAEAAMGSLRSTMEILSRDVPRVLKELTDVSTAKSLFIRHETDVWGSLRFLGAALAEANEHLSQRSTEVADLRLLCDELEVEAATTRAEVASARTEAQQRQLELGHVIGERDQSRSQAAEAVGRAEALGGQLAEVSARAGALVEDLAVAVGSAQSTQAATSEQRAQDEEFETALNESVKALAQAAEQKEADRVAMSEAISAFCQVFGLDDVPSGSSPQSRLRALGGHVRSRLREALHHDVRRAFAVLASVAEPPELF